VRFVKLRISSACVEITVVCDFAVKALSCGSDVITVDCGSVGFGIVFVSCDTVAVSGSVGNTEVCESGGVIVLCGSTDFGVRVVVAGIITRAKDLCVVVVGSVVVMNGAVE